LVYLRSEVLGAALPDCRKCANVCDGHYLFERGESFPEEQGFYALLGACANLHIPGNGEHSL
jgi:hypothetical protein